MSKIMVTPLDRPEVARRAISPRLRSQLCYFISAPESPGIPALGEGEFWFNPSEVDRWIDDGVFYLVSPLDTANMTEVELSEEQEDFLGWLKSSNVSHIRVED